MLPSVAAEVSTPLSKCKRIQMVSDGDGPVGASRVSIHNCKYNFKYKCTYIRYKYKYKCKYKYTCKYKCKHKCCYSKLD